jgi:hypothetical protein
MGRKKYPEKGKFKMIDVLNFKPFNRGSLLGFFTLRYHGLSIQNCRLMSGSNGGSAWFSFPQIKDERNDETRYLDILHLTNPERKHVRALILAELQEQGHIERDKSKGQPNGRHRTPEGENLSEHFTEPGQDDIPF